MTSSTPSEVCVTPIDGADRDGGSAKITCFDPRELDANVTYVVDECLRTRHEADGPAIIDARPAACPD